MNFIKASIFLPSWVIILQIIKLVFIIVCGSRVFSNPITYTGIHAAQNEVPYSGKFWRRKSLANLANCPWFVKLKPYLLADLLICPTFFCQMLEKSWFAKPFPRQTFLLYSSYFRLYSFNYVCIDMFMTEIPLPFKNEAGS